jgi:hypothetical protein
MNEDIKAIIWNIVGGAIVSIMTAIYINLQRRFRCFHRQRLLGFRFQAGTDVRITYGQFTLPPIQGPQGTPVRYPYVKTPRRSSGQQNTNAVFSMEHPISECEVRASTYITTLLAYPGTLRPMLTSDNDAETLLDSNFIALGGPRSNYKTEDILASPANTFVDINAAFSLKTGEALPSVCNNEIDHGIILRITSPQFPRRSWIVCAGLGEWGTSGAAWYLANKWEELLSAVHPVAYRLGFCSIPDFLTVIRVVRYQDQSAEIVALYRRSGSSIIKVR